MRSQSSKITTSANGAIKGTEASRPQKKRPIVWIFSFFLLVVIVIAFVVAPIYTPMAANSQNITFGSYAGKEIAYKDGNYFSSQYDYYIKNQNQTTNKNQAEHYALRAAFDATVMHYSILQLASEIGVTASNQKIGEILANDPRYSENGIVSKQKLAKIKSSEITTIRDQLIHERVANDLVDGPLESPQENNFIIDMGRWTRSFEYVSFDTKDFPDTEVVAYAQKHPTLFRTIELSSVTLNNKADATTFRQQIIDKKVSFEDIAKTHSIDAFKDKAGIRGATAFHELELELTDKTAADSVMALKAGEISPVLAVSNGFVLLRANSVAKEAVPTELGTQTLIRNYITENEKGVVDEYLTSAAKSFADQAKIGSFEKAARTLGKKVLVTSEFPINYSGIVFSSRYGSFPLFGFPQTGEKQPISNALENEGFFVSAFKLKAKEISDPVILQDLVLVLKVKTDKKATDTELDMMIKMAPQLVKQYINNDLQEMLIQKDKLVDNFEKTFKAHFVAR